MNVESLRSNQNASNDTAEIRIAKAAITICFLYVAAWTPYGVMALIGAFGQKVYNFYDDTQIENVVNINFI